MNSMRAFGKGIDSDISSEEDVLTQKSIIILCHNIDLGCIQLMRRLKKKNYKILGVLDDQRAFKKHKQRIAQKEVEQFIGARKRATSFLSVFLRALARKIVVKSYLIFEKVAYHSVAEKYSVFNGNADLAVLYSGEGLLSSNDLAELNCDLLNIHPAMLPEYRGLDAFLWALRDGAQQAVTAYIVDEGIDTGPIVQTFHYCSDKSETVAELRSGLKKLKSDSFPTAIESYFARKFENKKPVIQRQQNRGPMPLVERLKIENLGGATERQEQKLLYVSPSNLESQEANLVHVLHQSVSLANFMWVDLVIATDRDITPEYVEDIEEKYMTDISHIKLHRPIFLRRWRLLSIAIKAIWLCMREKYCAIISRNFYFSLIASLLNKKHIFEFHSLPKGWRVFPFSLILNSKATKILVISEGLKRDVISKYNIAEKKIMVAHDAATEFKKDPNQSERIIKVGYFGHLHEGRGIEVIAALAAALPLQIFDIIGGNPQQVKFNEMRYRNIKNLTFFGHLDYGKARKKMLDYEILLLPYQAKTYLSDGDTDTARWMSPLKLFEYMSSRAAIVSSDLPVLREILVNGENAVLVEPNNVEGWIYEVNCLLKNKNKRVKLADCAYSYFIANYSWDSRAQRILSFSCYESCN